MYSQFSLIRLKTNNKYQNVNTTKSFGNFIITGNQILILSKHLISSITTIEQSIRNLYKLFVIHIEAAVENFNDCFCPYRMKLPPFCSLRTNSAFTHFFFHEKILVIMFSILRIFFIFFVIDNPVYDDCFLIFLIIVIYYFYLCMSISDKYLGFLHVPLEYGIYFRESATKIRLFKDAG